jgi:hypothetical protein
MDEFKPTFLNEAPHLRDGEAFISGNLADGAQWHGLCTPLACALAEHSFTERAQALVAALCSLYVHWRDTFGSVRVRNFAGAGTGLARPRTPPHRPSTCPVYVRKWDGRDRRNKAHGTRLR